MSRTATSLLFLLVVFSFPMIAFSTVVRLDKEVYVVNGPGEEIDVQIIVEGNSDLGSPIRGGLFSFGTKLTFDSSKAEVADAAVVSDLDYFGFDSGAPLTLNPGSAGMEGNIDQFAEPLVAYSSSLLGTVTLTNKASAVDSYPLSLDFLRDLAPTEQQFLTGNGLNLDPTIEFRGARVLVVPEANGLALTVSAFSITCLWIGPRRRLRRALTSS